MWIIIKTLTGKSIRLEVECFDTILLICEKIKEKVGIPVDQMRLVYRNMQLNYYHTDLQVSQEMDEQNIVKPDITCNEYNLKDSSDKLDIDQQRKALLNYCKKLREIKETIKCLNCGKIGCKDQNTLADYNIGAEEELHLILMLRGC